MNELNEIKQSIVSQLHRLCAHCATGNSQEHRCPVQDISARIASIRGVPLIVNSEFKGVLFPKI